MTGRWRVGKNERDRPVTGRYKLTKLSTTNGGRFVGWPRHRVHQQGGGPQGRQVPHYGGADHGGCHKGTDIADSPWCGEGWFIMFTWARRQYGRSYKICTTMGTIRTHILHPLLANGHHNHGWRPTAWARFVVLGKRIMGARRMPLKRRYFWDTIRRTDDPMVGKCEVCGRTKADTRHPVVIQEVTPKAEGHYSTWRSTRSSL